MREQKTINQNYNYVSYFSPLSIDINLYISNSNPNHSLDGEKFEVSYQEICNTMGYPGKSNLYFFTLNSHWP